MASKKINSKSTSSKAVDSEFSDDVESICGSSIVEKIKKTLALLDLSGSKNASVKKCDDTSSDISSPLTPHEVSQSNTNLFDNLCYYPTSPTIMQAMVTNTSSMEETLANLTKVMDGFAKHVQNQDARIYKLIDKIDWLDGGRIQPCTRERSRSTRD
ncbi:hypothetical protein RND71_022936 [Anisodus tanguticus]|uniref:Uncharacterized protein n=1 Tax=Anisodus tanguticus TaxID=243964 RepID=A0AAE1VB58_9SOLA|nr:hypothetical protein RND71_022936 [Anisodus tanguticus]